MKKSIKIYLVGGAVRDDILGRTTSDYDYVVVGASPKDMLDDGFIQVGKSFPVFLHPKTKDEYALARKEIKITHGHTGFEFDSNPNISLEEDLYRRDFTINAMAKSEDGKIYDFHRGLEDLKSKTLRHVSKHFVEDPLRVLRAARFASELNFDIANETIELMKKISHSGELQSLSGERVFNEIKKSLQSQNPWKFWEVLNLCDALEVLFPELKSLQGVPQTKKYHPEGDVWIHTGLVLEACAKLTDKIECRWAALTHDLGKSLTPKEDLPSHKGHEKTGLIPLKRLNEFLKVPNSWKVLSQRVCEFHLLNHYINELTPKRIYKLFQEIGAFKDIQNLNDYTLCNTADIKGRGDFNKEYSQASYLRQCFKYIQNKDYSEIIQQHTGKELGIALKQKKISYIKEFKENQSI